MTTKIQIQTRERFCLKRRHCYNLQKGRRICLKDVGSIHNKCHNTFLDFPTLQNHFRSKRDTIIKSHTLPTIIHNNP